MSFQTNSVNILTAYLLWGLGFFGFCGLHRFYLGKPVSGIFWLLTFGLLFLGQFVDFFLIPNMVKERNNELLAGTETRRPLLEKKVQPMQKLLQAAKDNGNVLSLGQAILSTELPPEEVQKLLTEALRQNLAHIGNDPVSGAVRYHFDI